MRNKYSIASIDRGSRAHATKKRRVALGGVLAFLLWLAASQAGQADDSKPIPLQLEVTIGGATTNAIVPFFQLPDSRLTVKRGDLQDLGIKLPGPANEVVALSDIPNLKYTYDVPQQRIDIVVPDAFRNPNVVNARAIADFKLPQQTAGAYVNYTAFVAGKVGSNLHPQLDSAAFSFDAHAFGTFGAFEQSGNLLVTPGGPTTFTRLDSVWTYTDPEAALVYRAGDLISGGLAWTRPIRIGGLQIARDFAVRPDLVTLPLPSATGSAAVPSTLDVYIGNAKAYSTQIPSGPYRIDNLPVISGSGVARVVLTDVTGRQNQTLLPFFTDPRLLRQGFIDYSVEAGFVRENYGQPSSGYDNKPTASASVRYGYTDEITLEGHAEFDNRVANMGLGIDFSASPLGLFSGAVAMSAGRRQSNGFLVYGAWYYPVNLFGFQVSTQRTFGDYTDLASIPVGNSPATNLLRPPRAIDSAVASVRIPALRSSLAVSFVNSEQVSLGRSQIVNLSFSSDFGNGITLFATGFTSVLTKNDYGAFFGLSIPLGASLNATLGANDGPHGASYQADLQRSMGSEIGAWGGHLSVTQGANPVEAGDGIVRLRPGVLEASFAHQRQGTAMFASFDGSLVAMDGDMFASQRIDNAFAVVDAGAPNVDVLLENRPIGTTDSNGKLLVTGLIPYQENSLAVDGSNLPIDTDIPVTTLRVVPAAGSGSLASFAIVESAPSAVVIFTKRGGGFVDAGASGTLAGTNDAFFVGYDGRAFIKNLKAQNSVTIQWPTGSCSASFAYTQKINSLVTIGPISCQ